MIDAASVSRAAAGAAVVVAIVVVVVMERRRGTRPVATLRKRLLFGIPWGTLTTVGLVLAVYLFVQGGWSDWYDPVVTPFRAWTYLEPLGILFAGFAHAGPSHLVGNLIGTLTLAPLAEYAYGHYPRKRGASLERPRNNPYVRAFLFVPVAAVAVGLVTSVFSLGPVIGFSGVVFAYAGFAVVRYPLGTVVALTAGDAVQVAWRAINEPIMVASGRPAFITPWWADIAIHGHALGLLIGVILGGVMVRRRDEAFPAPRRLLAGSLLVGVSQALWAVYWFRGGGEFILFRAIGFALVVVLAVLVTALALERPPSLPFGRPVADGGTEDGRDEAADGSEGSDDDADDSEPSDNGADGSAASDDGGFRWVGGALSGGETSSDDPGTADESSVDGSRGTEGRPGTNGERDGRGEPDAGGFRERLGSDVGSVSLTALILVTALLSGVAIPTNLFTVGDEPLPNDPVEVQGYEIAYAENVENGMVSVVDVEGFGLSTNVETSGVIVRNPQRHVWTTAVSKGRLAFAGRQQITVGGVGWRETITVTREGFSAVGGGAVYRVRLGHDGSNRVVYSSGPADAEPVVAGWNVSLVLEEGQFRIRLARDNATRSVRLPGKNESITAGGVRFVRQDNNVFAVVGSEDNRTVVRIAAKEQYRGRNG